VEAMARADMNITGTEDATTAGMAPTMKEDNSDVFRKTLQPSAQP
jgi:hypothetical protein